MLLVGFKDFMLWDGVALLICAGIVFLGFRFEHPSLGVLVAGGIPVTNLLLVFLIWGNNLVVGPEGLIAVCVSPFLSPGISFAMLFALALIMMPRISTA